MNNETEMAHQRLAAEAKKLERECLKFQKCFMQFGQMQKELARYGELAEKDAKIKQKLEDLHSLLPGGLAEIKETFQSDIHKLNLSLRQLDAQLKKSLAQEIALGQQYAAAQANSPELITDESAPQTATLEGAYHQVESMEAAQESEQDNPVKGVAHQHQGNK